MPPGRRLNSITTDFPRAYSQNSDKVPSDETEQPRSGGCHVYLKAAC